MKRNAIQLLNECVLIPQIKAFNPCYVHSNGKNEWISEWDEKMNQDSMDVFYQDLLLS